MKCSAVMENLFFAVVCCLRMACLLSKARKSSKSFDFLHFSNRLLRQFYTMVGEQKRLTVDIHRSSLQIVWLHICGISDESTETTKGDLIFSDELCWLWNSKYVHFIRYMSNTSKLASD